MFIDVNIPSDWGRWGGGGSVGPDHGPSRSAGGGDHQAIVMLAWYVGLVIG